MSDIHRRDLQGKMQCILSSSVCVIAFLVCGELASAAGTEEFLAHKRSALEPMQAEYERICASLEYDVKMKQFRDRVARIDEVAALLIGRLESTTAGVFGGILGDIVDAPGGRSGMGRAAATSSARQIYTRFADRFSAELPVPSVTNKDMELLRRYYNTSIKAVEQYIVKHGEVSKAIEENAGRDVLELFIVMTLLHVPDRELSSVHVDWMPKWMKKPRPVAMFEEFSLHLGRPLTAAAFAQYGKQPWETDKLCDYVEAKGRICMAAHQYAAAIECLVAGIEVAGKAGAEERAMRISLSLAGLHEKMAYPQLAAAALKPALELYPRSPDWGKAAMLRLKYLYEAGQYDQIVEDAHNYQANRRSGGYLPQILYISWVTHRRKENPEAAEKLQQTFLEKFSKHPLAADMYFASAISALAKGDYAEALRLLEIIEYRYPKSRIMPKAKRLQKRLRKTLSGEKRE